MSKLRLRVDDLQVEGFQVLPPAADARGTVLGREILVSTGGTCFLTLCGGTCDGCIVSGGGQTCGGSTCDGCLATAGGSCAGSCPCTMPLNYCQATM